MFAEIVKHMEAVEFTVSELDQPVSITEKGGVATVRDLIADQAPATVRLQFSGVAPTGEHVRSVGQLDTEALKRITTEVLRQSDPDRRVAAIGLGDYSPLQLIEEVQRETVVGARVVNAVRLNGLFIEKAVQNGKIKPRDGYRSLSLPDFDF